MGGGVQQILGRCVSSPRLIPGVRHSFDGWWQGHPVLQPDIYPLAAQGFLQNYGSLSVSTQRWPGGKGSWHPRNTPQPTGCGSLCPSLLCFEQTIPGAGLHFFLRWQRSWAHTACSSHLDDPPLCTCPFPRFPLRFLHSGFCFFCFVFLWGGTSHVSWYIQAFSLPQLLEEPELRQRESSSDAMISKYVTEMVGTCSFSRWRQRWRRWRGMETWVLENLGTQFLRRRLWASPSWQPLATWGYWAFECG